VTSNVLAQRAERILLRLTRFTPIRLPMASGEELIGVYEADGMLVSVTSDGLYWSSDAGGGHVRYADLDSVHFPERKDDPHPVLVLRTRVGATLELPILGRNGRFADVYEFGRFVRHVIPPSAVRAQDDQAAGPS
jgi:hypothetical protein